MALISQGLAYTRAFLMVLTSDHISGAGGRTVTGSVGKSAGPWASFSGAVTEVGGGWYIYTYSTAETDTLGDLRFSATATSCDPTDFPDQVVGFNPGNTVNLGLTAIPAATAGTAGGLPTAVGGNAVGVNWSNVQSPTTAVTLTNTSIGTASTVTTGISIVAVQSGAINTASFASGTTLYGVTTVTQGMTMVNAAANAISTASFASGTTLYGVTTVTQGLTVVNLAASAIAAASAVTAFYNRIIDIAARRQYTNIRSSSDGETAVRWSLMGAIARLVNRTDFRTQPATIYHEDGSTSFFTETMSTVTSADAVVQLT